MKKYAWQNELGNDFEKCDIDEESRLRELFASSKSLGEFGRDVRAALKKLKELGLIEDFNAERGRIQITKKIGSRT